MSISFEELMNIITAVVEEQLALSKKRVLAVACKNDNKDALLAAARGINGNADYCLLADLDKAARNYDVFFVDYLSNATLAEVALGLGLSQLGQWVGAYLGHRKPVFVTCQKRFAGGVPAYDALFDQYRQTVEAYGVVFLDGAAPAKVEQPSAPSVITAGLYTKNVLSKADLYPYRSAGKVVVGKNVLVTTLAADAARDMKIAITRQE
jgi:hypothetical protein